jgi:hypothetical protein
MVVCYGTAGMVRSAGVSSVGGVVAMGMTEVTTLHSQGIGQLRLSSSHETELSSLGNTSRMVCSNGDPLKTMPMNMAPELLPFCYRPWVSKWSVRNSRSLKHMASPWVSSMPNR